MIFLIQMRVERTGERQQGLAVRIRDRIVNAVHREPVIERKKLFYSGVVIGLLGLTGIVYESAQSKINSDTIAQVQPIIRQLQDRWLDTLTEEQRTQLRDAEARTGFLKEAPLAQQTMRKFLDERASYVDRHGNQAHSRVKEREARWPLDALGFGFSVAVGLFLGPAMISGGLRRKK